MHGRKILILLGLLALAAVAPGAAEAKRRGTDRPLSGHATGSLAFDLSSFPLTGTAQGAGRVSHLGRATYSSSLTINLTGPGAFDVQGAQTWVAANGDSLFTTFTGHGEFEPPFGVGTTSLTTSTLTVTGGTGRFAGATGTITSTVVTTTLSIVGTAVTSSQDSTLRGVISY